MENQTPDNNADIAFRRGNRTGIFNLYVELLKEKPHLRTKKTIINIAATCKLPVNIVYEDLGLDEGDLPSGDEDGADFSGSRRTTITTQVNNPPVDTKVVTEAAKVENKEINIVKGGFAPKNEYVVKDSIVPKVGNVVTQEQRVITGNAVNDRKRMSTEVNTVKKKMKVEDKKGLDIQGTLAAIEKSKALEKSKAPEKSKAMSTEKKIVQKELLYCKNIIKLKRVIKYDIEKQLQAMYKQNETLSLDKALVAINNNPELPNFRRTAFVTLLRRMRITYHKKDNLITFDDDFKSTVSEFCKKTDEKKMVKLASPKKEHVDEIVYHEPIRLRKRKHTLKSLLDDQDSKGELSLSEAIKQAERFSKSDESEEEAFTGSDLGDPDYAPEVELPDPPRRATLPIMYSDDDNTGPPFEPNAYGNDDDGNSNNNPSNPEPPVIQPAYPVIKVFNTQIKTEPGTEDRINSIIERVVVSNPQIDVHTLKTEVDSEQQVWQEANQSYDKMDIQISNVKTIPYLEPQIWNSSELQIPQEDVKTEFEVWEDTTPRQVASGYTKTIEHPVPKVWQGDPALQLCQDAASTLSHIRPQVWHTAAPLRVASPLHVACNMTNNPSEPRLFNDSTKPSPGLKYEVDADNSIKTEIICAKKKQKLSKLQMEVKIKIDVPCRLCLNNTPDTVDIFSLVRWSTQMLPISRMVMKFANISVSKNDNLPHFICKTCLNDLKNAEKFSHRCEKTDQMIRYASRKKKMFYKSVHLKKMNTQQISDYLNTADDFKSFDNTFVDKTIDNLIQEETTENTGGKNGLVKGTINVVENTNLDVTNIDKTTADYNVMKIEIENVEMLDINKTGNNVERIEKVEDVHSESKTVCPTVDDRSKNMVDVIRDVFKNDSNMHEIIFDMFKSMLQQENSKLNLASCSEFLKSSKAHASFSSTSTLPKLPSNEPEISSKLPDHLTESEEHDKNSKSHKHKTWSISKKSPTLQNVSNEEQQKIIPPIMTDIENERIKSPIVFVLRSSENKQRSPENISEPVLKNVPVVTPDTLTPNYEGSSRPNQEEQSEERVYAHLTDGTNRKAEIATEMASLDNSVTNRRSSKSDNSESVVNTSSDNIVEIEDSDPEDAPIMSCSTTIPMPIGYKRKKKNPDAKQSTNSGDKKPLAGSDAKRSTNSGDKKPLAASEKKITNFGIAYPLGCKANVENSDNVKRSEVSEEVPQHPELVALLSMGQGTPSCVQRFQSEAGEPGTASSNIHRRMSSNLDNVNVSTLPIQYSITPPTCVQTENRVTPFVHQMQHTNMPPQKAGNHNYYPSDVPRAMYKDPPSYNSIVQNRICYGANTNEGVPQFYAQPTDGTRNVYNLIKQNPVTPMISSHSPLSTTDHRWLANTPSLSNKTKDGTGSMISTSLLNNSVMNFDNAEGTYQDQMPRISRIDSLHEGPEMIDNTINNVKVRHLSDMV